MILPADFEDSIRSFMDDEEYASFFRALQENSPVSIRLNRRKPFPATADSVEEPVPWARNGYYLSHRPSFTFDPLFHAGSYYVQEASSMFLEQAIGQFMTEPVVMLDLCAAPGGKSTHACDVLPEGSLLVANEVIRNRSQILTENLTKWGHPDVVVTQNDPSAFSALPAFFDVILSDAPCSGEGMFRKDPAAIDEWSRENVEICRQRQRRIVADVWPSLKSGGLFIYSTCTYNREENEENVRWICREMGAEPLSLSIPAEWSVTGCRDAGDPIPVYRFLPHRTRGEGFFLAVLRKRGEEKGGVREERHPDGRTNRKKERKKSSSDKEKPTKVLNWLTETATEHYDLFAEGDRMFLFSKQRTEELDALRQSLRIVRPGITVAELKGRDWIPAHGLAMSAGVFLRQGVFPVEPLSYEQAIGYLRKETVSLPPETPLGYVLLTYRDVPLGFAKHVGNRANNLYPQEWRIRSTRLPEEAKAALR